MSSGMKSVTGMLVCSREGKLMVKSKVDVKLCGTQPFISVTMVF